MERIKRKIKEINEYIRIKRAKGFIVFFYIPSYSESLISNTFPLEYNMEINIHVFYYDLKTKIKATKEILRVSGIYTDTETSYPYAVDYDKEYKLNFDCDVATKFQKILLFDRESLDLKKIVDGDIVIGGETPNSNKTFNELIKEAKK